MNLDVEDLKLEYEKNLSNYKEYDYRRKILKNNRFGKRLLKVCLSSLIPLSIILLVVALGGAGITSIASAKIFPWIMLGSSLGIGVLSEKILEKKVFKSKEKLRKFSSAKTDSEILEEETKYEIECEYLKNKNTVLKRVSEQSITYENDINNNQLNGFEPEGIENIEKLLKKAYNDLDVVTRRKVLNNKFSRYTDTMESITDGMCISVLISFIMLFILSLPSALLTTQFRIFSLVSPFLFSGAICISYIMRILKNKYVFDKLNEELGENVLLSGKDYEDDKELEKEINKQIALTSSLQLKYIEQNKLLKTLDDKSGNDKEKEQKFENDKQVVIRNNRRFEQIQSIDSGYIEDNELTKEKKLTKKFNF